MIITLTGFMGSGKTTVGKLLASLKNAAFVDLDSYIEHKTGESVSDTIRDGEDRFRALEAEAVRDLVVMEQIEGGRKVVALGGGTACIGAIRKLLREQTFCVWLQAPLEVELARLSQTDASTRPMLQGDVKALYDSRLKAYEAVASLSIDTTGKTPQQIAAEIALAFSE